MTWLNDWLYFTHHIIRNWNQNKSKQRNSERNKWMKLRRRYNYTSFFSKPLFTYWWIKFLDRWTFLKDWESTKGIRSCYWSCQGRGTSCHWEEDEQCWRKQKHTVGGKIIRILLSNNNLFSQEMLTSIKSHSEHVKAVRTNMEEQMKPKAQSIIESIAKKEETSK